MSSHKSPVDQLEKTAVKEILLSKIHFYIVAHLFSDIFCIYYKH